MADYSVILQSPTFRALVQENALDRMWHDALYPELLFRAEAKDEKWDANVGDNKTFTGKGLMPVSMIPLVPGTDVSPTDYPVEQWTAIMQQLASSIDTNMPTAIVAAVNKLMEDYKQLGLQAGQTMNKFARYKLFNAGDAGWTVANGAQNSVTTLVVKRLNGFTRARNPSLPAGSPVRYDFVSANNPLAILVNAVAVNVVGFTPDIAGDELGPGSLTLSAAVTVADRDPIRATTRTFRVISGGGNATDALTAGTDILHLADVRAAVQRLRKTNVQPFGDGYFHFHLDPTNEGQLFSDNEVQRLTIGLPENALYKEFMINRLMGCTFFRNNENPAPDNVLPGGLTATFSAIDPIAGELWHNGSATTGTPVHRAICIGRDALNEYYADQSQLETEAGITGTTKKGATVTNDGFTVTVDRIRVINRAPLDRLQQNVSTSWSFMGDFVMRTDGATGDAAVFKRVVEVLSSD
jgi:hypothetical protein